MGTLLLRLWPFHVYLDDLWIHSLRHERELEAGMAGSARVIWGNLWRLLSVQEKGTAERLCVL
jgi:hypothetical protein